MVEISCTFLLIYFLLSCLLLRGTKIQFSKQSTFEKIKLEDLTVIIPFRNEAKNLPRFIHCIKNQTKFPAGIIFIDDHSEDGGLMLLEAAELNCFCEKMPENLKGKKQAIRYGMLFVKTDYILTLDSDLEFSNSYFEYLEKLSKCDLSILPVVMKGVGFCEKIYEIDYAISNALNVAVAGLKRPYIASGANLLFKKSTFERYDTFEKHQNVFSGDDVFLLKDFIENNCSIQTIVNVENSVSTNTPHTISEFFNQRLRWINKGNKVNDQLSNGLAIVALVVHFSFISIVFEEIFSQKWVALFYFTTIKIMLDLLVFYAYFKKIERIKTWFFLPLTSFIYPFYILALILLIPIYKPKWKGRTSTLLRSRN
ncbi:MAG: glycosyltransferase [Flavobacteriia bacterium]|nr:glycosyltransferase [Flavobacteriia bacterium]